MLIHIYTNFILFLVDSFPLHNEYAILLADFEEDYHQDAYISNQ